MRFDLVTSLTIVSLAALGGSCAPRHDVFVAWTVDGLPAAQACGQLGEPSARVVVESRDQANGPVTEETFAASCVDGTPGEGGANVVVQSSNFAELFVEIVDGDIVYGRSDALLVNPGAGGHYEGHAADEAVTAAVELERGRLRATLRVVGETCGAAGASEFTVTLRRKSSPLGTEIVGEPNQVVACPGGEEDAIFAFAPVEIGSTYEVIATTEIGGQQYATDDAGTGEGVLVQGGLTDLTVDLDVVGRPD